ncbi:NADP-dependent oxidoreductase [Ktedonobacter racemifer]|uniref:Alcohol dehydrogenase zinc-binding domain protein n=1 Tax=Ktedonobacter racemifer DSM 44963 TaxID=485913 RepID=D6TZB1_KTERA|nr:NADP-dependent oxidoreductase [Ktedonobacter racemifer]EFH81901.1 Alcohol dehydrogenase zinc-binding domain protein [Ktedonobacter racemifer DSM 44963]
MSDKNMQVLFANRPKGWVQESDFKIVESEIPQPKEGQVLVKNSYLSLDPYMRGRMSAGKSYAAPMEIGDVMVGGTVGVVVESKNEQFKPGDVVLGYFGWQKYGLSNGKGLLKVPADKIPLSAFLGVLGMPGITAWIGLNMIGEPKPGETVVVSAASGAVGSVVGQLAKAKGCRAVGIAGGKAKCDYVVNELGFDACVDYKAGNLDQDLKQAAPNGIDIDFENVGGEILDTVLTQLNAYARIPLCGFVSQYNVTEPYQLRNFGAFLASRVKLQGFIVGEHMNLWPQAQQELTQLYTSGKLKYRESVAEGLENAPKAFIGMLKGENFGKQLVKIADR